MTCDVKFDAATRSFTVRHWTGCQDARCLAAWEADRYNHDAAKMAGAR